MMHPSSVSLMILFMFFLFTATKKGSATLGNSLTLLNQNNDHCTCTGQTLMFECNVTGVGSTVWRGSAFDCPLREIVLRHNQFIDSKGTCSNGAILARGVSVEGNRYTSRLNVTLSSSLNGETIACAHDNGTGTNIIGSFLVNVTSEPFPPPDNIHLSSVDSRMLTFSWNPVSCLAILYNITSRNCGVCPTITTEAFATCVDVPVDGSVCLFQVQTTVCNNSHGPLSSSVPITLTVPVTSQVKTVPCFSDKGPNFTEIQVFFNETDPFKFSDGIDGSATSYTINYADTASGTSCGSTTIPASSCSGRVCQNVFELSSSHCPLSDSITVTVFGTNVFGNGTSSPPVSTSTINNFVRVTVDLLSAAIFCQFIDDQGKNVKSCSIAYGSADYSEMCDDMVIHSRIGNTTVISDSVVISLPVLSESIGIEYCYVATVSNGTFTAIAKGTFSTACNPTVLGNVSLHPMAMCEAPFYSLGIENGVACYSGTKTGAVTFYSCLHCGLNGITNGSSVRVCTETGVWNGTTPRCSCQLQTRTSGGNLGFITTISITLVAFIIIVPFTVVCSIATCILAKDRAKFKRQFEAKCTIYEEIDIKGQSLQHVDTTENVAYAMHAVSETD